MHKSSILKDIGFGMARGVIMFIENPFGMANRKSTQGTSSTLRLGR